MLTALKFIVLWGFVSYGQNVQVKHAHEAQMEAEMEMMRIHEEMEAVEAQKNE